MSDIINVREHSSQEVLVNNATVLSAALETSLSVIRDLAGSEEIATTINGKVPTQAELAERFLRDLTAIIMEENR